MPDVFKEHETLAICESIIKNAGPDGIDEDELDKAYDACQMIRFQNLLLQAVIEGKARVAWKNGELRYGASMALVHDFDRMHVEEFLGEIWEDLQNPKPNDPKEEP